MTSQLLVILFTFFVQFIDKVGSERVCLSNVAMEMREQQGITIDSLDYEVSPTYLDSVRAIGAKVLHTSRWINGATVTANLQTIAQIEACDFVDTVYLTREEEGLLPLGKASVSFLKRMVEENSLPSDPPPPASIEQLDQLNLLHPHSPIDLLG